MRLMRAAVSLVAVVATAASARGQQPVPVSAQQTLDSVTTAELSRVIAAARGDGLPVEPVMAKARLGMLRHAAPGTIVAASRAVAERLRTARAALDPRPSDADVAAGADALSAGATIDALRQVRAAAPGRSVAVPLGVLAQLVASGVPVGKATAIVSDLLRRRVATPQLVALGNDVNTDVRAGERPEISLGVHLQQLNAVLGPGGGAATTSTLGPAGVPPKRP